MATVVGNKVVVFGGRSDVFAPYFTANDIYPHEFFYYELGTLCIYIHVHGNVCVYSTLAHVAVGRKERQPRQTIHTKPRTHMIKINEPQLPWLRTAIIYHTGLDVRNGSHPMYMYTSNKDIHYGSIKHYIHV